MLSVCGQLVTTNLRVLWQPSNELKFYLNQCTTNCEFLQSIDRIVSHDRFDETPGVAFFAV